MVATVVPMLVVLAEAAPAPVAPASRPLLRISRSYHARAVTGLSKKVEQESKYNKLEDSSCKIAEAKELVGEN